MNDYDNNNYVVYLLYNNSNNNTYIGITNNPNRRIRQHNKIIKGGARYTSLKKGNGEWFYYLHIINLTKSKALSLEKIIKNKTQYYNIKNCFNSLQNRLDVIQSLSLESSQFFFF